MVGSAGRSNVCSARTPCRGCAAHTHALPTLPTLPRAPHAGMVAVMDNDEHIGPFNIGNPGEFTMIELAEVVREVVNPNVEVGGECCGGGQGARAEGCGRAGAMEGFW